MDNNTFSKECKNCGESFKCNKYQKRDLCTSCSRRNVSFSDDELLEVMNYCSSYKEIAEKLNTTGETVKRHIKRLGIDFNGNEAKNNNVSQEERYADMIHKYSNGTMTYISGYEHSDGRVNFKCECGVISSIACQSIRKKNVYCESCRKEEQEKINSQKLIQQEWDNFSKTLNSDVSRCVKRTLKIIEKIQRYTIKECIECGKKYTSNHSRSSCCSVGCSKTVSNRQREISRRTKLRENGEVDYSISLAKLVQRDKGKCHICGDKVDMTVHYNDDSYGSIDHVFPVSKGGTHTWDNVKLAHRGCNNKKLDNIYYEDDNGQLNISI